LLKLNNMQTTIKFRGKRKDKNQEGKHEWIYGSHVIIGNQHFIFCTENANGAHVKSELVSDFVIKTSVSFTSKEPMVFGVIPETVGMDSPIKYLGKNHIFQGDKILDILSNIIYEAKYGVCIRFRFVGWYLCPLNDRTSIVILGQDHDFIHNSRMKLIGTIHDDTTQ